MRTLQEEQVPQIEALKQLQQVVQGTVWVKRESLFERVLKVSGRQRRRENYFQVSAYLVPLQQTTVYLTSS
jgi:hypothetical protein